MRNDKEILLAEEDFYQSLHGSANSATHDHFVMRIIHNLNSYYKYSQTSPKTISAACVYSRVLIMHHYCGCIMKRDPAPVAEYFLRGIRKPPLTGYGCSRPLS